MAPPTSLSKAYHRIDSGEDNTTCFNPAEYTLAKSTQWTTESVVGEEVPPAQFGGGKPSKLTLSLMLDDSDGEHGDVRKVTDPLFAAMEPDQNTASSKNSARPPMIEFGWGSTTTFNAVLERLSVQFTLFRPDGTPIRAEAKVTLLQVERAVGKEKQSGERAQNPTTRGVRGLRSHVVHDGDSLQSIAFASYGDATRWRLIAEQNGIDDPTRLERGTVLGIPVLPD